MSQLKPINQEKVKNLESIEIGIETVAAGDVADESHHQFLVSLGPDVNRVGDFQGFPSMPCNTKGALIVKIQMKKNQQKKNCFIVY